MVLIDVLTWLIAVPPGLALLIYSVELTFGLAPARSRAAPPKPSGSTVILIPAHNEAAGITATVKGLRSVAPGVRILVVADNCVDDTAARAEAAGAEVVERFDSAQRGKGYALAFGRDALAQDPPDTVIVVDADCELAPGSVEQLGRAVAGGAAAQATNLIIPDLAAPALVQISSFAMLVKNLVRSRGLGRYGGCALLTGTGMAFPGKVFAQAPLATGDIAEDLALGIALTREGVATVLVPEACVRSRAASLGDSVAQRRRWEHGFLTNALRHAVPTLLGGLAKGSRPMVALGLHLLVPPLALLFLIAGVALAALAGIGLVWGIWTAAAVLLAALVLATALTAIAWARYGRQTLSLGALLQAPLYIAWKIPTYLRFLVAREGRWQRARREGDI